MALRRDAGQAAVTLAALVPAIARRHGSEDTLWNVGNVSLHPGGYSVVPGTALLQVEYRDTHRTTLDLLTTATEQEAHAFGAARGLDVEVLRAGTVSPASMDQKLTSELETAATALGAPFLFMKSGAGHDAMALADRIPCALLFVPSVGGRSHSAAENTAAEDIVLGARVLARAVETRLAGGS